MKKNSSNGSKKKSKSSSNRRKKVKKYSEKVDDENGVSDPSQVSFILEPDIDAKSSQFINILPPNNLIQGKALSQNIDSSPNNKSSINSP